MLSYTWRGVDAEHRFLGGLWKLRSADRQRLAEFENPNPEVRREPPDFGSIWSRLSRQSAKLLLMILYAFLLTSAGLAMAAAAIIIIQPPPDRATLGLLSIRLASPLQEAQPVSIDVRILNSGKTQAKNVESAGLITHLSQDPVGIGEPSEDSFTASNPVAPNSVYVPRLVSELQLSKVGLDAIRAGTSKIYVYGIIRYKDYQGNPYKITYCAHYDPATNAFPLCNGQNTAD
jgi:hypothetical protein